MTKAEDENRSGEPLTRVIQPLKHRVRVSEIWTSWHIAWLIGLRDMRVKYKQAALGPLWLFIAPLGMVIALTIAFYGVTDPATSGVPYFPFMLTGLTVWSFFAASLALGSVSLVNNSVLVRRSPIPRITLITGTLIGNLPPLGVLLVVTLIVALAFGVLTPKLLLLPLLLAWLFVLPFGLSLFFGSLACKYRDAVALLPLIIQAGIFVTPVGYGISDAPRNIQALLVLNPLTGMIEAWRWAIVDLPDPSHGAIAYSAGFTIAALIGGWLLFRRLEVGFADYV